MALFRIIVSGVTSQVTAFTPRLAVQRLPSFPNHRGHSALSSSTSSSLPIPITLLAGFLGAGKTSCLKHLLENKQGLRLGVLVNDVASVNIDSKIISGEEDNVLSLQNGCVCCSIADEMFTSVQQLCRTTKSPLDAIVVELSGVADPKALFNNWKMAPSSIRQLANIERVVTLVDAQTFGTDFMTFDMVQNRDGWADPNDASSCSANLKISELLAEQVEVANLILVNKVDLVTPEQVLVASKVAAALNDKAVLHSVSFGHISPSQILGLKTMEESVETTSIDDDDAHHTHSSHDHSHASTSTSHTDQEMSHSHAHNHDHSCEDPDCTDHSHSHSHSHATSTLSLGISNFVYKADRPFDSGRLLSLLNRWPVPRKDILDVEFIEDVREGGNVDVFGGSLDENPFLGVLRSKGFIWLSPTQWSGIMEDVWRHDTAMYMSHAGRHMSIDTAGKWWAAIPPEKMDEFFAGDLMEEKQRIITEDFVSEEFGDRRQELVFIGVDISQTKIRQALDLCLLTDGEMSTYRSELETHRQPTSANT